MNNPITVSSIVEEFLNNGGTFVPNWDIETEKKLEAENWLRTQLHALLDHIEEGFRTEEDVRPEIQVWTTSKSREAAEAKNEIIRKHRAILQSIKGEVGGKE